MTTNENASAGTEAICRDASVGPAQFTAFDPTSAFLGAIAAAGLGLPEIVPNGALHRYHVDGDRPGTRNGWYVFHLDGAPAGAYGSWKTGEISTWCSKPRESLPPVERARIARLIETAKRQRQAETEQKHANAAKRSEELVASSNPASPAHPYLVAKEIRPHGIRQIDNALLIPITVGSRLASVQCIYHDGTKRFLAGGRISGGYYRIDDETRDERILICEGFATGASLHEHTGAACYVAFNAGNLLAVARYARRLHPRDSIIICGDDDQWATGNPGKAKARRAAIEAGCLLSMPDWTGLDLSSRPTDFNDWYRLREPAGRALA